jgi:O-antigen ligase
MQWLLIGYMFLFIHRPFEFWPMLGDLHVERIYILGVIAYWCIYSNKRWLPNAQHLAYAAFAVAVLFCWAMSPWMEDGQTVVENWFKILVFYFLLVSVAHDERMLKQLALGFLFVMGLYMAHSFKEFLGGRYTFRMSIVRMIGVDTSLGDPNSFGASILFALPFVTAFWNTSRSRWLRFGLILYVCLSTGCILLTGSRSSFLGLILWGAIVILRSRHWWKGIAAACVASPIVFLALPESLQTRFETIIDPEVGPENARVSGEGRLEGLYTGAALIAANPLGGIGPGAWRPATGSKIESHNLYGQILGEMGMLGVLTFGAILLCFWSNLRWMKRTSRALPGMENEFVFQLARSVAVSIFLLLFEGNFGHNLFRHNWLWFGGFLIIARYCVTAQFAQARSAVVAWPRLMLPVRRRAFAAGS